MRSNIIFLCIVLHALGARIGTKAEDFSRLLPLPKLSEVELSELADTLSLQLTLEHGYRTVGESALKEAGGNILANAFLNAFAKNLKIRIKHYKKLKYIILAVTFTLGVIIGLLFNCGSKQEFAYVNFDKVIKHVMNQVNQNHKDGMVIEAVESYKGLFVTTLDEYAKKNKVVIFSSPKPVAGARDITDLLIAKTFGQGGKDGS